MYLTQDQNYFRLAALFRNVAAQSCTYFRVFGLFSEAAACNQIEGTTAVGKIKRIPCEITHGKCHLCKIEKV